MIHLSFHRHKKVFTNRQRDSLMRNFFDSPYLDWLVIILFSTVLSVVCIGIGIFSYVDMKERLANPSVEIIPDRSASFNVEALANTLKRFDDRAAERSLLLGGYSGPGDPSI